MTLVAELQGLVQGCCRQSSWAGRQAAHLAMRPTGNCRPALDDLLTCFLPAVLPLPRPAPDMLAAVVCAESCLFRRAVEDLIALKRKFARQADTCPAKLLMLPTMLRFKTWTSSRVLSDRQTYRQPSPNTQPTSSSPTPAAMAPKAEKKPAAKKVAKQSEGGKKGGKKSKSSTETYKVPSHPLCDSMSTCWHSLVYQHHRGNDTTATLPATSSGSVHSPSCSSATDLPCCV